MRAVPSTPTNTHKDIILSAHGACQRKQSPLQSVGSVSTRQCESQYLPTLACPADLPAAADRRGFPKQWGVGCVSSHTDSGEGREETVDGASRLSTPPSAPAKTNGLHNHAAAAPGPAYSFPTRTLRQPTPTGHCPKASTTFSRDSPPSSVVCRDRRRHHRGPAQPLTYRPAVFPDRGPLPFSTGGSPKPADP